MNLAVPANHPLPYGPPIHIIDVSPIRSSVRSRRQERVSHARRRIGAAVVAGGIALLAVVGAGTAIAVMPA